MKNDLSGVKVGDYIWTVPKGWVKVTYADPVAPYAIVTLDYEAYTLEGKRDEGDTYPSAFLEPPEGIGETEPKPCEFKKGQRVLVWDDDSNGKYKRYFSHLEDAGLYHCFPSGLDEWANNGRATISWLHCRAWENDDEK